MSRALSALHPQQKKMSLHNVPHIGTNPGKLLFTIILKFRNQHYFSKNALL